MTKNTFHYIEKTLNIFSILESLGAAEKHGYPTWNSLYPSHSFVLEPSGTP